MADKLKVGIVGSGAISTLRHIPAFRRLRKKVVIQAVCDRNEDLALEVASKYKIPMAYAELSTMLSKEKLDLVDICTPPQTHASLAMEAMEQGCHVILEKPMSPKTSDCDEMINASYKHKVKLCVVHNQLFYSSVLKARKLVAEGAIGNFIGMRIFLSDPRDEMVMKKDYWVHKLPGGLIGETGPHLVYMSLAFLNKVNIVDIYAKNFLEHPWAPFDEFRIEIEGENGLSSILISYASNRRNSFVDILGTEGALHLDLTSMLLIRQGKRDTLKPVDLGRYSLGVAFQIVKGVAANTLKVATRNVRLGHDVVIERFVDSVLNDEPPPVTGEEGRETIRVMEMIVERLQEKYGV